MKNSELFKEFVEFLLQIYLKTILRVVLLADLIKKKQQTKYFLQIFWWANVFILMLCVYVWVLHVSVLVLGKKKPRFAIKSGKCS